MAAAHESCHSQFFSIPRVGVYRDGIHSSNKFARRGMRLQQPSRLKRLPTSGDIQLALQALPLCGFPPALPDSCHLPSSGREQNSAGAPVTHTTMSSPPCSSTFLSSALYRKRKKQLAGRHPLPSYACWLDWEGGLNRQKVGLWAT